MYISQYTAEMLMPGPLRVGLPGDHAYMTTREPLSPPVFYYDEPDQRVITVSGGADEFQFITKENNSDLYCGTASYKKDTYTKNASGVYGGDSWTYTQEITKSRSFVFDDGAKTVTLEEDVDEVETGLDGDSPRGSISRTYTGSAVFNQQVVTWTSDADSGTRTTRTDLEDAWSSGDIDGVMSTLLGKPDPSEWSGDHVLGLHFVGFAGKTESTVFKSYAVSAGQVKGECPWFQDSWASGLTGSLATHWNGNFSVVAKLRRRRNSIGILEGSNKRTGPIFDPGGEVTEVNPESFPNGYVEVELTDSLENHWAVDGEGANAGEFYCDQAGDFGAVFSSLPLVPVPALETISDIPEWLLGAFWCLGNANVVRANEITFMAGDGGRYRITIQVGHEEFGESGYESVWDEEHVATMAEGETSVSLHVRPDETTYYARTIARILRIEWYFEDVLDWGVWADAELFETSPESYADPMAIITGVPRLSAFPYGQPYGGKTTHDIIVATKKVEGEPFGFYALDGSGTRWRNLYYRKHLTPHGYVDNTLEKCGDGYPSGSNDFECWATHIDGQRTDGIVTEDLVSLDGVEDEGLRGPITQGWATSSVEMPSLPLTVNTATLRRVAQFGITTGGSYLGVFRNFANPSGEVVEEVDIVLPASISGVTNVTDWSEFVPPPAAGTAWFAEEQRLTP
jgi:hypothetical protein